MKTVSFMKIFFTFTTQERGDHVNHPFSNFQSASSGRLIQVPSPREAPMTNATKKVIHTRHSGKIGIAIYILQWRISYHFPKLSKHFYIMLQSRVTGPRHKIQYESVIKNFHFRRGKIKFWSHSKTVGVCSSTLLWPVGMVVEYLFSAHIFMPHGT